MIAERTIPLLNEVRHSPMLWLLAFVPAVFAVAKLGPDAHTLLFVLSVLAIVPLAAPLSHATESVAAKTGDAAGGLLNATLGNLTELVIALTALRAGETPWPMALARWPRWRVSRYWWRSSARSLSSRCRRRPNPLE